MKIVVMGSYNSDMIVKVPHIPKPGETVLGGKFSTAAGGKVDPVKNGAHIGIASDVIVNNEGQKHFIYKDKKKIFTSPAFNFDEVSELPKNAILLSSDKVNNVMGVSFSAGNSEIIGLQYHPDYEYFQMLNLMAGRKERLFKDKNFSSEE